MFTNLKARLRHRWQLMNFRPAIYNRDLYGISLKVFTNSLFAEVLFGPKRTDWKEIKFIQEHMIKDNEVVCDVGANIGFTTMFMSKCAANVLAYAVEPNPVNLQALYKNIELNDLQQQVTVIPFAAGKDAGKKIRLTVHPNSSMAAENEEQETYEAETVSLDLYFSAVEKKPSLLKIDVEGAELMVLQGAKNILAARPKLAIEIHVINFREPLQTLREIFEIIDLKRYHCFIQTVADGEIVPFNESEHTLDQLSALINLHLFCLPH
jgi:FkbM family methyltransferase